MRVFLDANILFSAAKTNGAVRELLRLVQRILQRPKPQTRENSGPVQRQFRQRSRGLVE